MQVLVAPGQLILCSVVRLLPQAARVDLAEAQAVALVLGMEQVVLAAPLGAAAAAGVATGLLVAVASIMLLDLVVVALTPQAMG
jgi:hypothetical protein